MKKLLVIASLLLTGLGQAKEVEEDLLLRMNSKFIEKLFNQSIAALSGPDGEFDRVINLPDIVMKDVQFSNVPELLYYYGSSLFDVGFDRKSKMLLRVESPRFRSKLNVSNVRFRRASGGAIEVELPITLNSTYITTPKLQYKELTFIGSQKLERSSCESGRIVNGFSDRLWAEARNVSLGTLTRSSESQIRLTPVIRFKVDSDKNQISLSGINHSLLPDGEGTVLPLEFNPEDLHVPPLYMEMIDDDGSIDCLPVSTVKFKEFFHSMRAKLSQVIVKGLGVAISKRLVERVNTKLANINQTFKVEKVVDNRVDENDPEVVRERYQKFSPEIDDTRVYQEPPVELYRASSNGSPSEYAPSSSSFGEILNGFLSKFHSYGYSAGLEKLSYVDSRNVDLIFKSDILLNDQWTDIQPSSWYSYDVELSRDKHDLQFAFNERVLSKTIDILVNEALDSVLPSGVTLLEVDRLYKIVSKDKIAVVPFAEVDLGLMEGIGPRIGYLVEKYFGGTGGKLRMPLQFEIGPTLDKGKLKFDIDMPNVKEDPFFNEMNYEDNIDDANILIQLVVKSQLKKLLKKIPAPKKAIDLNRLARRTGVHISSLEFDPSGFFKIGVDVGELKPLTKAMNKLEEKLPFER